MIEAWGGLKRDAVALFGKEELEPQIIESLYLLPNLLAQTVPAAASV